MAPPLHGIDEIEQVKSDAPRLQLTLLEIEFAYDPHADPYSSTVKSVHERTACATAACCDGPLPDPS